MAARDPLDRPLHGVAVYNPELLSKPELIAHFVARRSLLEQLASDLGREGETQHHLIVGQRGMGKTMLLRRLRHAVEDDPDLDRRWIPLAFPEEQYNISRLSDLYVNCIDALGDALEQRGRQAEARRLEEAVTSLPDRDEPERAKRALDILLSHADKLGRRLLLLIDNLELILDRLKQQQWGIRELLSAEKRLLLIGASSAPMEITYRYKEPFYDFFQIHELRGLSEEETREVMLNLARLEGAVAIERALVREPARLQTLRVLTGGNPRIIALLYSVLSRGMVGDVRSDLERLLDQCTPLYKARFEALPPQAQQLVAALAIRWDPVTAGQLAELVRLETNTVSAQLNRLVQQGVVEKVPHDPTSKTAFQIAERFFNIWYLMRAGRRVRRRLIWLVEFLEVFHGAQDELVEAGPKEYEVRTPAALESHVLIAREPPAIPYGALRPDAKSVVESLPALPLRTSLAQVQGRATPSRGALPLGDSWAEAASLARGLLLDDLESAGAPRRARWSSILALFREAARAGHAADAVALLDDLALTDRYRPLREALAAIAAGTQAYLRRVAPEIRHPAERLIDELLPAGLD
jgi:hypothetical protein